MDPIIHVLQLIGVGFGALVMAANVPRPSKGRRDVAVRLGFQLVGLALAAYSLLGFPGVR